jgi:hypothetical protein
MGIQPTGVLAIPIELVDHQNKIGVTTINYMATPLRLVVKVTEPQSKMTPPEHNRKEEKANRKETPVPGRAITFLPAMTRLHLPLVNQKFSNGGTMKRS